ncbi:MAG: hypothetical protein U0T79_02710 [Ferruginibacter sp.]
MKRILVMVSIVAMIGSSCTKSTDVVGPIIPPRENEYPVFGLAFKQDGTGELRPNYNLTPTNTDYPTEYGIEFSTAKKGILYAIGFRMPQAGKYYVSLWDVATRNLVLRDSADYTDPSKFLYVDFSQKKHERALERNKKYMASVYAPRSPLGSPRPYYTLLQPGVNNWVPFTKGTITVSGNYFKKEDFPVYPETLILHADVLNGLVDIGFYKTEY